MALVLAPEAPISEWFAALDALLARTPDFFVGRPVVLELGQIRCTTSELADCLSHLQSRSIRIMGIEGISQADLGPGLPPAISGGRAAGVVNVAELPTRADTPVPSGRPTTPETREPRSLLIDAPVRSGQSIIFLEGDVTVIGSVASGAEVVAGGSVHVYGSLRGRAIAGATGNASARIFCNKLEAELLAIDGLYKTADTMDRGVLSRAVQARLEGESLVITTIS